MASRVHDLGVVHRHGPGDGPAPVVTDQHRGLGAALVDEIADVGGELVGVVGRDLFRPRRQVVAAHVGCHDAESRRRERLDLPPPAVPELGEAVQQDDQRPVTRLDVMQPLVADLGVALPNAAGQVRRPGNRAGAFGGGGRRGHEGLFL